jgi:hypothetical protein
MRNPFRFTSLLVIGVWFGGTAGSSQQISTIHPTLRLEKQIYVAGESIRFWIGVSSQADIPEALRESGVVHIAGSDGSEIDDHVSWPMDFSSLRGYEGGWGFGARSPGQGRYVVWFEFAGQRTSDQSFAIIPNPFSNNIAAQWIFLDTKSGGDNHVRSAILHIENRTGRILRIAKPGLHGSEVGLNVRAFQPPASTSLFVSQSAMLAADEIPAFSLDNLDWDNQSRWPMITVPAGGSTDRSVPLESSYSFRNGQEYEITISIVLTVFVGERDDHDAQLFPLRLPASRTARIRW